MVCYYVIKVQTQLDFGRQQGSESGKRSERDKEREGEKELLTGIWFIFMLLKSRQSSTLGGSKVFWEWRQGLGCCFTPCVSPDTCLSCSVLQCVAVCCSMLQYVAGCCSVLQCVAVCCSVASLIWVLHYPPHSIMHLRELQCVACVAECCSVLRCVAVWQQCPE